MLTVSATITITKAPHVYVSAPGFASKVYLSARLDNTIVRCYLHGPTFGLFCLDNVRPASEWVVTGHAELAAFSTTHGTPMPILRITDVRSLSKSGRSIRRSPALQVEQLNSTLEQKLLWLLVLQKLDETKVTYNDGITRSDLKKYIRISRVSANPREQGSSPSASDDDDGADESEKLPLASLNIEKSLPR